MKTALKRFLSLLLCLLTVLTSFSSCQSGEQKQPTDTEAETAADEVDPNALTLDNYRIIINHKIKDDLRDSARRMVSLIQAYTGKDVMLREDDIVTEDASYKEILIGATNRAASSEALATLGDSGYIIQNNGGTIVINGVDERTTADAVEYFVQHIIRQTGDPAGTHFPAPPGPSAEPQPFSVRFPAGWLSAAGPGSFPVSSSWKESLSSGASGLSAPVLLRTG